MEFKVEFPATGVEFPPEADVYIEPYYRNSTMRFNLGKFQDAPFSFSGRLDEIQSETVFFRVKIVDNSEKIGRILGFADGISPGADDSRASLLPVTLRDLGDRIWRIDYEGLTPVLEVNNQFRASIAIGEVIRKEPAFLTLVMPAVLREILTRILLIEEITDLDGEEWQNEWLRFAQAFPGVSVLSRLLSDLDSDTTSREDWIEDVVDAFSRYHHVRAEFEGWLGQER